MVLNRINIFGLILCIVFVFIILYEYSLIKKYNNNRDINKVFKTIIIVFIAIIWGIISLIPIYDAEVNELWEICPFALFPIIGITMSLWFCLNDNIYNSLFNIIIKIIFSICWGGFFGGIMLVSLYGPLFLHNYANLLLYAIGIVCVAILINIYLRLDRK